jgi:hypothetical protein
MRFSHHRTAPAQQRVLSADRALPWVESQQRINPLLQKSVPPNPRHLFLFAVRAFNPRLRPAV